MDWPDGSRLSDAGRKHLKMVRKHLDEVIEMVSESFAEHGGFLLQLHLMMEPRQLPRSDHVAAAKTGVVVVQAAGIGEDEKEMLVEVLKMICSRAQVFAVFALYRAWVDLFNEKSRPLSGDRVKNMSNRKEVCVVSANFLIEYDCYTVWCCAEIDRSSEKPSLKPWNRRVLKAGTAGGWIRDCIPHLTPLV